MKDAVIQVIDFHKVYGEVVAVDGISFEVQRGEVFGLLGPNGAGKTSTLECLEGIRAPDGGTLQYVARRGRESRSTLTCYPGNECFQWIGYGRRG